MIRSYPKICLVCILAAAPALFGQKAPAASQEKSDKASAYYHYSVAHLYAELATSYGNRSDLFSKAVENYKEAMKADPSATFIAEELSDLYIQSGRLRDAVTETEDLLKQNPDDLNARRILARIYTRMIGDAQSNKIDEGMVKKALEQYQTITQKDPSDIDSWLMLGRLEKISQNSNEAEKAYKKALELDPNNEDAMTGLAMVYADLGDTQSATDLLKKAADKNPNPRSLTALASAYEQMKEFALAASTLKHALDLAPGNSEIEHALAQDYLLSDQLDDSLKMYEQLLAEDPKDVQSQLRISQIYREKRDFAKAQAAADKAREMDPDNLEIKYNDVNLLQAEGKIPEAIKVLKGMLNDTVKKSYSQGEKANRIMLTERLAYLYRQNEQYPQAIEVFRQISELDPDSGSKVEAEVIETYRTSHDFTKAQEEADAALKRYPNDRIVQSAHAQLLADLGKTDQAAAEARKLLNGKDDYETYVSLLAPIYEKAKNFTEMGKALDAAEKVANTKQDKENVLFMRGAMYERMKNYDAAETEFRKVIEQNPDNASALNYLGYMLADRNVRLEEAQQLISRAVDREPNNGAYLDSLGWVYFRMNKLDQAERNLQRALELLSTDPTVHDHLGDVYFHEGKIREAIAQWQNSLEAYKNGAPSDMDHSEVAKVQKKLETAKVRLARESHGQ